MTPGEASAIFAVWWVAALALVMTAVLAVAMLTTHAAVRRRDRRRERVHATWRLPLFEHALGLGPPLPAPDRGDEEHLLDLWNQLRDEATPEGRRRLDAAAEALGLRRTARGMLQRSDALRRLLAIRTLGSLADPADYDLLAGIADDTRPYLCLAAALALARIDRRRAPHDLLPRLAQRRDWPVSLFAVALGRTEVVQLAAALRTEQARLPPADLVRLLPLTSFLPADEAGEILRALLAASDDPEVLCGVLREVRDPALLPIVRRASRHAAWSVRTQAASALGRVGGAEDRLALLALLKDPHWWVRYRAAQALTSGRFGGSDQVVQDAELLQDRFAVDIVQQAIAEEKP